MTVARMITGLDTPRCTSIPAIQAQNVAFAPTERSMPAVIRHSSIPVESSALNDVCFRMLIKFENFKKFGDAIAKITHKSSSAISVPSWDTILLSFFALVI